MSPQNRNKSDVYEILRTFSKHELRLFQKFLHSEYFGKKPKLTELVNYIVRYHPMYNHVNLDKQKISQKLYNGKSYVDSTIRNLFCDLHEKLLHFMMIKNFESTESEKYNFLYNELSKKGLPGDFFKIVNENANDSEEIIDTYYFLNQHIVEANKFNLSHNNLKLQKERNIENELSYLNTSVKNLIYHFVTRLLAIYINFIFYKNTYNTSKENQTLYQLTSLIDFNKIKSILGNDENLFVIELYELMLKAFENQNDITGYHNYKNFVNRFFNRLGPAEKCFHYYKLITYCIRGNTFKYTGFDYDAELKQLYTDMLENKYYLDRNTQYLPHETYRNILFHGIRTKNYTWVIEFVKKYSFSVFPQDRENIYYYGKAYLNFNLGNYRDALECINQIDVNYFVYKADIKNLTLMIYYELGDIEGTLDLIISYKEFIRKNKLIHPERKTRYLNFSKFLEKIVLCRAGTLKQDIDYISNRLELNKSVAFKPWLQEKISSDSRNIKIAG